MQADREFLDLKTRKERESVIPILKESFTGVYRWHAKRTLLTIPRVRAVRVGDDLAGAALLERLVPEAGYVYYIFVGARYRRAGIGGRLLDDALGYFRRSGSRVVYAAVEEDNAASLALFRSREFRTVDRSEPSYREGGLGAQGIRSRMWVVYGELLLGVRLRSERDEPSSNQTGSKIQAHGPSRDTTRTPNGSAGD
jgi:ribosomal protein S18 acetylase RimI-like enzyme